VADEGDDLNAFCIGHGIVVQDIIPWSGKGGDIYGTTERAFSICAEHGLHEFFFDSDGMGVGVRGDARVINQLRGTNLMATPFRGSAAVIDQKSAVEGLHINPERDKLERRNEDYFKNFKAQSWWSVARRFERTYRAVVHGESFDSSQLISLNSRMSKLAELKLELEQPIGRIDGAGKMIVDKAPNFLRSPNLADALMMRYQPKPRPRNSLFG